MLFRPRLVLPAEYAGRWAEEGPVELSPSGRLAFVELLVDDAGLDQVLDGMTDVSADWLRKNRWAPSITTVARYENEPKGENDYLHVAVSLGLYRGEYTPYVDCEDLEIAVSAERRARGEYARPIKVQTGERLFHIVTDLGNGRVQDTTKLLLRREGRMT